MKKIILLLIVFTVSQVQAKKLCISLKSNASGKLRKAKTLVKLPKGELYWALKRSKNRKYVLLDSTVDDIWVKAKYLKKRKADDCEQDLDSDRQDQVFKNLGLKDQAYERNEDLANKEDLEKELNNVTKKSATAQGKSYFGVELGYGTYSDPSFMTPLLVAYNPNNINVPSTPDPVVTEVYSGSALKLKLFYEHLIWNKIWWKWNFSYAQKTYEFDYYKNPYQGVTVVPLSSAEKQTNSFTLNTLSIQLNNIYYWGEFSSLFFGAGVGLSLEYTMDDYTLRYNTGATKQETESRTIKPDDLNIVIFPNATIGWNHIFVSLQYGIQTSFNKDFLDVYVGYKLKQNFF